MIGQFIGYIIGAYFVYYIGNIIYDLFLAKPKVPKGDDDGEIISLGDIVSNEKISNVSIEDVETVNMPESYEVDESQLYSEKTTNEEYDLSIQKNYEEEESEEWYEQKEMQNHTNDLNKVAKSLQEIIKNSAQSIISEKKEYIKNGFTSSAEHFESLLSQAQMQVVMTNNNDGHKTYKSTASR